MTNGFQAIGVFDFALIVLASYRVAYLITREDGPFDLAARLRGRFDPNQQTWLGRGLNCIRCVSFWTSPLIVLAWLYLPGPLTTLVILWLAVAGGVLIVNSLLGRL